MIKICLFACILLSLVFISCSTIYTTKNFSSKEKLYKNFNWSVKKKTLNVTFMNDSSMVLRRGAIIEDDSLFSYVPYKKTAQSSLSEVKKINYIGRNYKSATLLLKNGDVINARNVKIIKDSIQYSFFSHEMKKVFMGTTKDIKQISYKNTWLGILPWFVIGTGTGFMAGLLTYSFMNNGSQDSENQSSSFALIISSLGPIAGIICGWITGYKYVYKFNP